MVLSMVGMQMLMCVCLMFRQLHASKFAISTYEAKKGPVIAPLKIHWASIESKIFLYIQKKCLKEN